MSWKDDKDLGPWEFEEQSNVWGYLNNPRWSSLREAVEFSEAVGNPIDPTETHRPCKHWHKGDDAVTVTTTSPAPDINIGTNLWYQESIDVHNGIVGMIGMAYVGDGVSDGIVAEIYDVESKTFQCWGVVRNMFVHYATPNTCRISSNGYIAYYGSMSDFKNGGYWVDSDWSYSMRLYIFEEGEEPRYTDVWSCEWGTGTPYECWDYAIYDMMDCIGDRIACLAYVQEIDGVAHNKWMVKTSEDAGLTFPTEYSFPTFAAWAYEGSIAHKLRMSNDGTIWVVHLVNAADPPYYAQLWKSTDGGVSFTKIWETNFFTDAGMRSYNLGWDISNTDGKYQTISVEKHPWTAYDRIMYVSDDYGATFTTKTVSPENISIFTTLTAEERHITVIAKNTSISKDGFARSTDHGDNFSWLVAVITYGGLTNNFMDVVNKTYIKNNTITYDRQGIIGSTVGNSRIFTADPSPDVSHYYPDMQKHFNEIVYCECGESYTGGDYIDLLYSDDNGATWIIIQTPIPNGESEEDVILSGTVTSVTTTELNEPQVWQI